MGHAGKIVVTGAAGFVGANLCRAFAERGHPVVAVEHPGSLSAWRLQGMPAGAVERVALDLTVRDEVVRFVREARPEAVFHCAAYGAYSNQTDADRIYRVCFDSVRYLLEALRGQPGFRAFVQAGSSSEYGMNCAAPAEDAACVPDSDYSVAKVAATSLVRYHAAKHGTPAWVFRLYSAYGPLEDASRLIPKLLLEARAGRLPPLVNPAVSRDFVHVDDLADAYARLLERADTLPRGEIYNLGTGTRTRLADLVDTARQTFALRAEPQWGSMPDRRWDHPDWYANPAKAARALGWSAQIPLAEGLRRTMRWIEENPAQVEASLNNMVTQAGAGAVRR